MRRFLVAAIAASLVGLFVIPAGASAAPTGKVDVCHAEGNGSYHLINISENAFPRHVEHGDVSPGGAVPDMTGYNFGEDCVPECEGATVQGTIFGIDPTSPNTLVSIITATDFVPFIFTSDIDDDGAYELCVPATFDDDDQRIWEFPASFYVEAIGPAPGGDPGVNILRYSILFELVSGEFQDAPVNQTSAP